MKSKGVFISQEGGMDATDKGFQGVVASIAWRKGNMLKTHRCIRHVCNIWKETRTRFHILRTRHTYLVAKIHSTCHTC